ncbi:MAG: tetratricopeptide repeat protein, partial [Caulobacteraceae bacterium]
MMKRPSIKFLFATTAGMLAVPALALAMGMGGMGGGGMPSGGADMSGMSSQPQYDPAQEYQVGSAELQAGKYKDAARDFERVVRATPKAANAWLMLGMSKSGQGDEKGAEKAYERSVKLDGSSIAAHRELALSLIKLKKPDQANAELAGLKARAATCADTCPDAADLKAAIAAVEAELNPAASPSAANDPETHLSLATPQQGDGAYVRAVSLINEHRWDEALASLDKAQAA